MVRRAMRRVFRITRHLARVAASRGVQAAHGTHAASGSFVSETVRSTRANVQPPRVERRQADADAVSRPALTVLTTPILPATRRAYTAVRGVGRRVLKPGTPALAGSRYPGHYAVTRSVVEGLRTIGADFNFNPVSFSELGRLVYAPANEALRQAIALKRRGAIDFLVAGPVNAFFVDECDSIIQAPEIDLAVVASDWMIDFYRDVPELARKSRSCPCGVDAEFWKPTGTKSRTAVVYWKSGDEAFCEAVEAIVR